MPRQVVFFKKNLFFACNLLLAPSQSKLHVRYCHVILPRLLARSQLAVGRPQIAHMLGPMIIDGPCSKLVVATSLSTFAGHALAHSICRLLLGLVLLCCPSPNQLSLGGFRFTSFTLGLPLICRSKKRVCCFVRKRLQ